MILGVGCAALSACAGGGTNTPAEDTTTESVPVENLIPRAETTEVQTTEVQNTAPPATAPPETAPPATPAPTIRRATATPAPTDAPAPAGSSTYYKNCDEARAAGAAPINRGEPGYRSGLDRDDDGIACDT